MTSYKSFSILALSKRARMARPSALVAWRADGHPRKLGESEDVTHPPCSTSRSAIPLVPGPPRRECWCHTLSSKLWASACRDADTAAMPVVSS